MKGCPSLEQIEQLVSGRVSPEEDARIREHLEACAACTERVERHQTRESLLADVRRAYSSTDPDDGANEFLGGEFLPGYQILEKIHRGGQGVVFKAVHISTQRTVAVKILRGGPLAGEQARRRLDREVRLAAGLRHPHIVGIHDSGVVRDSPYIVMDFVSGLDITEHVYAHNLSIADRLHLFVVVCEAIEYAHLHGVVHRDLKPSNILVSDEGEPVLVDFGLARGVRTTDASVIDPTISSPGQVLGSLPYLAPEQAAGDLEAIDEQSDIYALGVLLHELLTGTRPPPVPIPSGSTPAPSGSSGRPPPPSQACVGLDRRLDAIVLKALEYDKFKRYRSAGDFAAIIRTYLDAPLADAQQPARHRIGLLGLSLYAVVATAALAVVIPVLLNALRRPPIPDESLGYPTRVKGPATMPDSPNYHGRKDTPFFTFKFDELRPGQNPPLIKFIRDREIEEVAPRWLHFEGANTARSEGRSNLYTTRFWCRSRLIALRSETGRGVSGRVDALNVWEYVEKAERVYYQCYMHLEGTPEDMASFGFVADHPTVNSAEFWGHIWTNQLHFEPDGQIRWKAHSADGRRTAHDLGAWPRDEEFVCLLRVELDFPAGKAHVWIDGRRVGNELPVTAKQYHVAELPDHPIKLNRWAFQGPSGYTGRKEYHPRYLDIDDLEIGAWEQGASEP